MLLVVVVLLDRERQAQRATLEEERRATRSMVGVERWRIVEGNEKRVIDESFSVVSFFRRVLVGFAI